MLPENHKDIVEAIMVSASRFRGMAHSELGSVEHIDEILKCAMPYLYASADGVDFSPIIDACGRYLDNPYGQGFYNIVVAVNREPALKMCLQLYQNVKLPTLDIKWCLED